MLRKITRSLLLPTITQQAGISFSLASYGKIIAIVVGLYKHAIPSASTSFYFMLTTDM